MPIVFIFHISYFSYFIFSYLSLFWNILLGHCQLWLITTDSLVVCRTHSIQRRLTSNARSGLEEDNLQVKATLYLLGIQLFQDLLGNQRVRWVRAHLGHPSLLELRRDPGHQPVRQHRLGQTAQDLQANPETERKANQQPTSATEPPSL